MISFDAHHRSRGGGKWDRLGNILNSNNVTACIRVDLADLRPVGEWHVPAIVQSQGLTLGLLGPNPDDGLWEKPEKGCCQPIWPGKGRPLEPCVSSPEVYSAWRREETKGLDV